MRLAMPRSVRKCWPRFFLGLTCFMVAKVAEISVCAKKKGEKRRIHLHEPAFLLDLLFLFADKVRYLPCLFLGIQVDVFAHLYCLSDSDGDNRQNHKCYCHLFTLSFLNVCTCYPLVKYIWCKSPSCVPLNTVQRYAVFAVCANSHEFFAPMPPFF